MRSAASRRARASVCASEHPSRPFAFGKGGLRVRTVEKYAGRRGLSLGVTFLALRAAFLSDSPLGGRRRRAWTCEDASPQGLATRIEPRLLRKSCPAIHARLASGRAHGLFGNQEHL